VLLQKLFDWFDEERENLRPVPLRRFAWKARQLFAEAAQQENAEPDPAEVDEIDPEEPLVVFRDELRENPTEGVVIVDEFEGEVEDESEDEEEGGAEEEEAGGEAEEGE
jgi:hypothetical protein